MEYSISETILNSFIDLYTINPKYCRPGKYHLWITEYLFQYDRNLLINNSSYNLRPNLNEFLFVSVNLEDIICKGYNCHLILKPSEQLLVSTDRIQIISSDLDINEAILYLL